MTSNYANIQFYSLSVNALEKLTSSKANRRREVAGEALLIKVGNVWKKSFFVVLVPSGCGVQ